jgi:hypothetical protein
VVLFEGNTMCKCVKGVQGSSQFGEVGMLEYELEMYDLSQFLFCRVPTSHDISVFLFSNHGCWSPLVQK